jgi:PIN domain nuclease of toxin-antitoxin system
MKLLLDTHTLLWWMENPVLLSKEARRAIQDGRNAVYISAAVIWEIVIKRALGKLTIPDNLEEVLIVNKFKTLPITASHVLALQMLPEHHKDPFDRMLIAQTICEGFQLVTRDPVILKYAISCLIA